MQLFRSNSAHSIHEIIRALHSILSSKFNPYKSQVVKRYCIQTYMPYDKLNTESPLLRCSGRWLQLSINTSSTIHNNQKLPFFMCTNLEVFFGNVTYSSGRWILQPTWYTPHFRQISPLRDCKHPIKETLATNIVSIQIIWYFLTLWVNQVFSSLSAVPLEESLPES